MNRITRPRCITYALFCLLLLADASAVAGEVREPTPTAPTLYFACMSTGGRFEYDSAAFSSKNPGPDYQSHQDLNVKMGAAFDAYLTQKYGFHGLVNCGRHNTLAEAKQWLQWRESESRAPGRNYQHFATDWTYDGARGESASSAVAATATAATTQAGQAPPAAAASPAGGPTAFVICIAMSKGIAYESAIFEASNDAGTARRMQFMFASYLAEKYKAGAMPVCTAKPTRAALEAHLQQFPAGVHGGVSQHVSTGWVYNPTPSPATQPVASAPPAASAPSAPTPVPAAVAPKPYQRAVRCNKQPTLAEAQTYYQTTLDQARLLTSINGIPSPIVVTDWQYK